MWEIKCIKAVDQTNFNAFSKPRSGLEFELSNLFEEGLIELDSAKFINKNHGTKL